MGILRRRPRPLLPSLTRRLPARKDARAKDPAPGVSSQILATLELATTGLALESWSCFAA